MASTRKGWNRSLMASLFHKEASYDAGHAMADANACSLTGYELDTTWDDKVVTDKDEVTGKEHGYDQEIVSTGYKATLKFPKVKPNDLAGFASYALGSSTPTRDGEVHVAYKHKIVPATVGTALNSMQVEELFGGLQYYYRGVKVNTLKLSGEAGGLLAMEVGLIGSGTRATSATAMAAAITESWMKLHDCKVWLESGANISIDAALTQDAENISGATPDNLYPRLKNFEITWDNGLAGQEGFGGAGVFQDIDYSRRKCALKFSLQFNDTTELDYYTSQAACAIEFDLKGAIVETSDYYYGCHIVIPRFKLKSPPLPKGGANDTLTADYDCEVFDDGTNAALILEVYNGQAAYMG